MEREDPKMMRDRLAAIARIYDQRTQRHLSEVGVAADAVCLEVGAGIGSVAQWIARQVGRSGRVVATDVTEAYFQCQEPNVTFVKHDIGVDPLAEGEYDCVHARFVLEWVPARIPALAKMVAALKPGGWLVVESTAWGALPPPAVDERWGMLRKVRLAFNEYLATSEAVYDPDFAVLLPWRLAELSLQAVGANANSFLIRGNTDSAQLAKTELQIFGKALSMRGLLDESTLESAIRLYDDKRLAVMSPVVISAWGRKP